MELYAEFLHIEKTFVQNLDKSLVYNSGGELLLFARNTVRAFSLAALPVRRKSSFELFKIKKEKKRIILGAVLCRYIYSKRNVERINGITVKDK